MNKFDLLKEMDNFVYDSTKDSLVHKNVQVEQSMAERAAERAEFYRDMAREDDNA